MTDRETPDRWNTPPEGAHLVEILAHGLVYRTFAWDKPNPTAERRVPQRWEIARELAKLVSNGEPLDVWWTAEDSGRTIHATVVFGDTEVKGVRVIVPERDPPAYADRAR